MITGILIAGLENNNFSIADFYVRRVRRIVPALALILVACLAIGWVVLLADEYKKLSQDVLAAAAFVSNFKLWHEAGYFDRAAQLKPLLHLWSLGIEEQFYIVWPALLWCAWRLRIVPFCIAGIIGASFLVSIVNSTAHPVAAFYSPISRFWELMLGCALAYLVSREFVPFKNRRLAADAAAIVGMTLIVVAILLTNEKSAFPGWWAVLPTMGACLILLSPNSLLSRKALANPTMVGIGLISYPLYLWHWPLLSFVHIALGTASEVTRTAIVALSVLLAWTTYKLVEAPIRFGTSPRSAAYASCGLLLASAVVGCAIYLLDGAIFRFPPQVQAFANYQYDFKSDAQARKCWVPADAPPDGFAPSCFSASDAEFDILVWGDSFAARLYPGLVRTFGDRGAIISQLTRDGCPPVLGMGSEACVRSNAFILSEIRRARPDVVVLAANWFSWKDGDVGRSLHSTLDELKRAGVPKLVVVGSPPMWEDNLPKLVYQAWRHSWPHVVAPRLKSKLDAELTSLDERLRAVAVSAAARYLSLYKLFCNSDGCLTLAPESEILTSWDVGHITTPAALFAAQQLSLRSDLMDEPRPRARAN